MIAFDPARLYTTLLNTGLQTKDNPLYQVLYQLIGATLGITKEVNGILIENETSSIIIGQSGFIGLPGDDGIPGDDAPVIVGPRGPEGPMVPYFIASTETFSIPEFKQALFAMNIDNEGMLEIDGFLIEVDGFNQLEFVTVTAINYTVLIANSIIKTTSTGIIITLPTAVGYKGKKFTIDNEAPGSIIVEGDGTETIEGLLFQTILSNNAMTIYSDGSNWRII